MATFDCWGCGWEGDATLNCACPNCGATDYLTERNAPHAPITEYEREAKDPDFPKLLNWFSHHPPDADQVVIYEKIRRAGMMFARTLVICCPPSADRTAALRKVREAVMTANAAVACGGK